LVESVHLLYFWRGDNYRRDLDHGVGFHLNQANPLLHQIQIGESLWAFTRRTDGRYALAAELVVSAKTMNTKGYRYGPYRAWGDLRRSRYFSIDGQPDVSMLIRSLDVEANSAVLGRSFQGRAAIRALGDADHARLFVYAERIPLEPRARLLPEERLGGRAAFGRRARGLPPASR
jgi:5-methylcytosine-specific restriction enzyme A